MKLSNTEGNFSEAKTIYSIVEFRQYMRHMQNVRDEYFKRLVPKIEEKIRTSWELDPIIMFERLMKELSVEWDAPGPMPLNSEIHHYIVPGVIMTSLRNCGYEFTDEDIHEGILRGQKVAIGSCGFMGICCGAHSVGIVICLVNKTNPLYEDERSETFLHVADTLTEIARYTRRCCKRSSYMAIEKSVVYLKQHGYDKIGESIIHCKWSSQNKSCDKRDCLYFIST